MQRFRILKKGEPEKQLGEGCRFSEVVVVVLRETPKSDGGLLTWSSIANARVGMPDADFDWLDAPEDDWAEPVTPS